MIFFVVADPREAGGVGRTKSDVERSINWREALFQRVLS